MTSTISCILCILVFVFFNTYWSYKYSTSFPVEPKNDVRREKKTYVQKQGKIVKSPLSAEKTTNAHHKNTVEKSQTSLRNRRRSIELEDYFQKLEDIEFNEGYNSIENVDENRIEELLNENDKNVVVFFYDRDNKCSDCRSALEKMEEIDDDLESAGYIDVVKSRDFLLSRELGINKFPAMIYFRRRHPILYDENFQDSQEIYRWVRAHDQVVTFDLEDRNFEDITNSYVPSEGSLDWFVLFYNSKNADCLSYVPMWETVAYRLRGYVNVGKVDIHKSDDVAHRFKIDDEEDCPTIILMRRGKMYRFKQVTREVDNYVDFALQTYKEQRGKKVPHPPTPIEELYEELKEYMAGKITNNREKALTAGGLLLCLCGAGAIFWWIRRKNYQNKETSRLMEAKKDS